MDKYKKMGSTAFIVNCFIHQKMPQIRNELCSVQNVTKSNKIATEENPTQQFILDCIFIYVVKHAKSKPNSFRHHKPNGANIYLKWPVLTNKLVEMSSCLTNVTDQLHDNTSQM